MTKHNDGAVNRVSLLRSYDPDTLMNLVKTCSEPEPNLNTVRRMLGRMMYDYAQCSGCYAAKVLRDRVAEAYIESANRVSER